MKKLIAVILSLTALTLSSQAYAELIAGIDNVTLFDGSGTVTTSDNNFITRTTDALMVPANDPSITEVLIDSGVPALATYVLSVEPGAYIDMSFGTTVTGFDELVFFFAGGTEVVPAGEVVDGVYTDTNGVSFDVYVDANGDSRIVTSNFDFSIINGDGSIGAFSNGISPFLTTDFMQDVDGLLYPITAAILDLDGLNLLAPGETLEEFRIALGNDTFPVLSGVGYIEAVPLPLPIVLFSSGLVVLGLFGRRKTR